MSEKIDPTVAKMTGSAALPRRNGELVFAEPWQSRVFGIAVALHGKSAFPWAEFQRRLIDAVAAAPGHEGDDATETYYRQWLAALESLVIERGLLSRGELADRRTAIAAKLS